MYDHILVGVDGSDESNRAARYALELAARVDAAVTAVHVVEQGALDLTRGSSEASELREERAAVLAAIDEIADEVGHPADGELLEGNPAKRLTAHADEADADLIVLGRQGLSGVKRRLLGGTTEQVLHRSEVPVFVVPDEAGPFAADRLLVPTDGSENAGLALPHAAELARIDGGSVDLLNVIDLAAAGGAFDAGGLDAEFVERLENRGQAAVEDAADEIRGHNPDVEIRTAVERAKPSSSVAASIRAYVEDEGVDAVVMSSHGRSDLRRTLLGSVASSVLRRVDVPVLVAVRGER
ncbi:MULTISPECIES: universal stress protein [Halolamina]|uniref:Nucleotide-binding universal stress protein, UspA family n=1 Tax=Halolamina pelagica TaxID=699431 RepID=A0A1I5Q261_9EURY|nr:MULTISPECIES: universal stress protein [Halolamina]NHX35055.1 universal stress protein [Halolamina sp. R1-12]SFP40100.1 Nucleotide-binding universal stress protein, UspA family [Halolamina pelagica]